jgi:hypothetical protein
MRDQIDGRLWAEHGHLFAEQLGQLLDTTMRAFERLNAIEFAAPWRANSAAKC